jgi:hypothetical protein
MNFNPPLETSGANATNTQQRTLMNKRSNISLLHVAKVYREEESLCAMFYQQITTITLFAPLG